MLIGALRDKYPDLPIHVHTHDTSGAGGLLNRSVLLHQYRIDVSYCLFLTASSLNLYLYVIINNSFVFCQALLR